MKPWLEHDQTLTNTVMGGDCGTQAQVIRCTVRPYFGCDSPNCKGDVAAKDYAPQGQLTHGALQQQEIENCNRPNSKTS